MALITEVIGLSKYIPSIVNVEDFTMFEGELQSAENKLKYELLGEAVYAHLGTDAELSALCEEVVAFLSSIQFIPQLDLLLTESGFVVTSNSNQSPASKERVERLIKVCKAKAAQAIENLQLYLESKDDYYADWSVAKYCSRFDDLPCSTNSLFRQYAMGWDDRKAMAFVQRKPSMILARERFIIPKIGQSFYDYILANPSEEKILPIIHNFRMAYCAQVMGDFKAADNVFATVWAYIIENKSEYAEFDEYYTAPDIFENSTDNKITVFGA